jgi:hypothetical protein
MVLKITNDKQIAQWIDNDETLYRWWLDSNQSQKAFIRINRMALTSYILRKLYSKPTSVSELGRSE